MKPSPIPGGDLRAKILRLLASTQIPAPRQSRTHQEARAHPRRPSPRSRNSCATLEQEGAVARIKKDRYVKPDAADLFPGLIHFNDKGYAFVISETKDGGSPTCSSPPRTPGPPCTATAFWRV